MSLENHWADPKTNLVDPHWTKNGQNAPSCTLNPSNPKNEGQYHGIALSVFKRCLSHKNFYAINLPTSYMVPEAMKKVEAPTAKTKVKESPLLLGPWMFLRRGNIIVAKRNPKLM